MQEKCAEYASTLSAMSFANFASLRLLCSASVDDAGDRASIRKLDLPLHKHLAASPGKANRTGLEFLTRGHVGFDETNRVRPSRRIRAPLAALHAAEDDSVEPPTGRRHERPRPEFDLDKVAVTRNGASKDTGVGEPDREVAPSALDLNVDGRRRTSATEIADQLYSIEAEIRALGRQGDQIPTISGRIVRWHSVKKSPSRATSTQATATV